MSDEAKAAARISLCAEIESHIGMGVRAEENAPHASAHSTSYVKERVRLWRIALAAVQKAQK